VILSDFDLWNYIRSGRLAIEPFSEDIVRENGLDLRIGRQIARFNKKHPGLRHEKFKQQGLLLL
jgi:dCTP deaminase